MIEVEEICQDVGRPGCLKTIDKQYTMDFTDIDEGYLYFCSHCGPLNAKVAIAFEQAVSSMNDEQKAALVKKIDGLYENNKASRD